MKTIFAAGAALAVLLAGAAYAAPLSIAPMTLSPEAQKAFDKTYGARDADVLGREVHDRLAAALTKAGAQIGPGAANRLEVVLVSAKPTKPTMKQLSDQPGLDFARSRSVGGAELSARFVDASGRVVQEVGYKWFETDFALDHSITTWGDADIAIDRFADRVAEAYAQSPTLNAPAS